MSVGASPVVEGHILGKEGSRNAPLSQEERRFHISGPLLSRREAPEPQWKGVIREEFPGQSKTPLLNCGVLAFI